MHLSRYLIAPLAVIAGLALPSAASATPIKHCGFGVTARSMPCETARMLATRMTYVVGFPERCYRRDCHYKHSANAKGDYIYRVSTIHFTDRYGCDNLDVFAQHKARMFHFQTMWDCHEPF
jgi:hypothetical protein